SHTAENLEKLMANVDETAKKLLADRSKANLRAYREAVRNFMKEAVGGSYRMKGERRWDRRGNTRILYLIERVNQNMEEVAAMVLQEQADAMAVMAKLDEIRGLLIDLYY
ncbi:MAG TPA: YaaR family protein, partial [Firmicutes bacterium]|nr:YaaR family protein [Bacillota bacterium]